MICLARLAFPYGTIPAFLFASLTAPVASAQEPPSPSAPPQATPAPSPAEAPAGPSAEWKEIVRKVKAGECDAALPELKAYVEANPDAATAHYFLGYCNGLKSAD